MTGDVVKLGDKISYVDTFVDMLRKFPRTVQVNVILNSCYYGIFEEKFPSRQPAGSPSRTSNNVMIVFCL